jgi:hypothetical protein
MASRLMREARFPETKIGIDARQQHGPQTACRSVVG